MEVVILVMVLEAHDMLVVSRQDEVVTVVVATRRQVQEVLEVLDLAVP